MDLKTLRETPPWDWPEGTGKGLGDILRDREADGGERLLAAEGLSELFGLEMAATEEVPVPEPARTPAKSARARRAAKAVAVPEDTASAAKPRRQRALSPTKRKTSKARPTTNAKKRSAAKR